MRIAVGLAAACVALALSGSASGAAPCSGLVVDGTPGNDVIRGGSGDDCLRGGDGADQLYGGFGADQLDGGAGNDVIEGDQDRNVVRGGAGDDRIDVSNGVIDDVDCGPGRDRVVA